MASRFAPGRTHPATAVVLGLTGACTLALPASVQADEAPVAAPLEVAAADLGDAANVETITVTATRVAQPAFDVPASVDVRAIDPQNVGVNLAESLENVPGLLARDRQNYAQDTQVSIRGFGARSTFGIRGVRLYLDGIPATQPDGQGQVSHFNLATADRVEILRGPFSALYGNSSGGVIQLFTADGSETPEVYASVSGGSFDTWRTSLGNRGSLGAADYNFGYTYFKTEGFRDHSEAERRSLQGKLNYDFGRAGRVTLLFNDFDSPEAQDPLGLTRAQFDARPSQAAPQAITFNTRKRAEQTQGGLVYDLDLGSDDALRALAYYGHRDIQQFLAIPAATQANARHSGGVVDLGTDYGGGDLRWTHHGRVAERPWWIAVGLSYDGLSQARRGYENFVGSTLGVQGRLRRDEDNDVESFDQYLQAGLDLSSRWSLLAGVRRSHIEFESHDHYVVGANGDDSGSRDYSATAPVAGVTFKAADWLNLYGSYGTGFETPTLVELAYSPLASPSGGGLNLDLDAARSRNAELGAKLRLRPELTAQLALFRADTKHELAVASNTGGRATYTNIDRTRRQGVEVSIDAQPLPWLDWQLAYTYLHAEVREGYVVCGATPCATPDRTVAAGSALPGVPQGALQSTLSVDLSHGLQAFVTGTYIDSVPVNDTDTESAPSYALADLGASWRLDSPHWRTLLFLRCDNVFDQDYVGSVIVNDGNGRYYEPGPGRSVVAGVNLSWKS